MALKKLFLFFAILSVTIACQKNDNNGGNDGDKKFDYFKKITATGSYTNPVKSNGSTIDIEGTGIYDSLEYITKYAWLQTFRDKYNERKKMNFGLDELYHHNRDVVNFKFLYNKLSVVDEQTGELSSYLRECKDNVIVVIRYKDGYKGGKVIFPTADALPQMDSIVYDTVAYIPNKVFKQAAIDIQKALDIKDYETCYNLFDNAIIFLPTTGEKWRKMKEAGIE